MLIQKNLKIIKNTKKRNNRYRKVMKYKRNTHKKQYKYYIRLFSYNG